MLSKYFLVLAVCALGGLGLVGSETQRIFREPRLSRGNINLCKVQPIDEASWVSKESAEPKDANGTVFLAFRCEFESAEKDGELVFDVSADERFLLRLDGEFVARGPNRADIENWQYQTYRAKLLPGKHVMEAIVWKVGNHAPLAQLTHKCAFILKANGAFDGKLTTGKAPWIVAEINGIRPIGSDNGVWGTGAQFEIKGRGPYVMPKKGYEKVCVVKGPAASDVAVYYGVKTGGWMLFPSQLPDQTEYPIVPGSVRALTHDAGWREAHVYTDAETEGDEAKKFSAAIVAGETITVPAGTRIQFAWDLGRYYCAYPEVIMDGAAGAKVYWGWAESARNETDKRKGNRDEIKGKFLWSYGDVFISDGAPGEFSSPWFRCGRWCRVDIDSGNAPLKLRFSMKETRYPLEMESVFESDEGHQFDGIRRICARAMQMCAHEMLFDCPYYEQQMYPGDTRIQLNVISALTPDDRLIKRAIELYDLAVRDDGNVPFNWPTRGTQEGASYTLCYLCMYGDYVMNHADREWLRHRIPGLRKTMAGIECYENKDGLLENLPGWIFMDWTVGWRANGVAPGSMYGEGVNAELNLFWALAMRSAIITERAMGNELQAQYWERKLETLKVKIVETFWCDEREMIADTPAKKDFSEHAQSLAIVGDVLPADKTAKAFAHLVADEDLKRCTVYFSYYLFEAYFKQGRADMFLKRLDLWRDYLKIGMTTLLEAPDSGKNGQPEARSDCHAWGAHPIWFMQTALAGIKPAAPFFSKVEIAPQPASLKRIKASHPHPEGFIKVDFSFDGDKISGKIETPVEGVLKWNGKEIPLKVGTTTL